MIVGLGNPGRQYAGTPHNAGFDALDGLAGRLNAEFRRSLRFTARVAKAEAAGERVWLVKPETFMNRSGVTAAAILRCNGLGASDMIVISDDADLELGVLRVRRKGSSGGHRGLESIRELVGSTDFARVRIGIGRGEGDADLVRHVLKPLAGEGEREVLAKAVARAADAVLCMLEEGIDASMNRYNGPVA